MSDQEDKPQAQQLVEELWDFLGQLAREAGVELPQKFQPSALDTYGRITKYLKSEVDKGRIRIIVYPQGDGKVVFYLQQNEPHETDDMGNLVGLGIPIQRVNDIITKEIFVNLHFVYWNNPDGFLKLWESSNQPRDMLQEKFVITRELLSHDLEERILLARSLTANSLIYSVSEIHWREVPGRSGGIETIASALVKLIIREHISAQPSSQGNPISFELTLGEVRNLIHDLEITASKLEAKHVQG